MGVAVDQFVELSGGRGFVSAQGTFKNARGVVLHGYVRHGYRHVQAGKRQERLHRLVAEAFLPNPESKAEVNHIDGNKLNNAVSNLEWATHKENMRHAVDCGLHVLPHGESARHAKLKQCDVDYIRATYKPRSKGRTLRDLGEKFGVTEQCVHRIIGGKSWPAQGVN